MAGKQTYQLFEITLRQRINISASLVRFTFTGPDVRQMATHGPDQRIKLFFSQSDSSLEPLFDIAGHQRDAWYDAYRALPDAIRPFMRTYTIRSLRAEQAEVDVEFVLHGDNGPASRWALQAQPGDQLAMAAPSVRADDSASGYEWKPPRDARRLLIIADETALPAAAGILETLDSFETRPEVDALLEVPHYDDIQPLDQAARLRWLARDTDPECKHGDLLLSALRDIDLDQEIAAFQNSNANVSLGASEDDSGPLWDPAVLDDDAPFYVWIAAETKVAMQLRRYLVKERGVPKQYVTSMGYWRLGKANS